MFFNQIINLNHFKASTFSRVVGDGLSNHETDKIPSFLNCKDLNIGSKFSKLRSVLIEKINTIKSHTHALGNERVE